MAWVTNAYELGESVMDNCIRGRDLFAGGSGIRVRFTPKVADSLAIEHPFLGIFDLIESASFMKRLVCVAISI